MSPPGSRLNHAPWLAAPALPISSASALLSVGLATFARAFRLPGGFPAFGFALPNTGWLAAAGPGIVPAAVLVGIRLSELPRASAHCALEEEAGFLPAFGFLCRAPLLLPSPVRGFLSALDSLP